MMDATSNQLHTAVVADFGELRSNYAAETYILGKVFEGVGVNLLSDGFVDATLHASSPGLHLLHFAFLDK